MFPYYNTAMSKNLRKDYLYSIHSHSPSSSSVGATARCGLWPVEQYLSICPYLSPSLSIFSLPTLRDLFPLLLSIFQVVTWFVHSIISVYLVLFRPSSLILSSLFLCSTFVTIRFLLCGLVSPTPNLMSNCNRNFNYLCRISVT